MPSPFPGMNPYLEHEDAWHIFHEQFPMAVVEVLVPQVRPDYFVRVDEHVDLHEMPEDRRRLWGKPDVALSANPGRSGREQNGSGGVGLASSTGLETGHFLETEETKLSFVEIRDRRSRCLVTVIELLSPSNKEPGPDREQYLGKRRTLLRSPAHFIEIDLLRGGARTPLREEVSSDYLVIVSCASRRPEMEYQRINLRDPLPTIPIPLLEGHKDAQLDLQAILHRLYDAGGYEDFIYQSEPQPPLSLADAAWGRSLLPTSVE